MGASGAAMPRRRFAFELDAEARANDYVWEGVPAWGHDEEQQRWARSIAQEQRDSQQRLHVECAQQNAVHDSRSRAHHTPAQSIPQPALSARVPTGVDYTGSEEERSKGRCRQWDAGLGVDLKGAHINICIYKNFEMGIKWKCISKYVYKCGKCA